MLLILLRYYVVAWAKKLTNQVNFLVRAVDLEAMTSYFSTCIKYEFERALLSSSSSAFGPNRLTRTDFSCYCWPFPYLNTYQLSTTEAWGRCEVQFESSPSHTYISVRTYPSTAYCTPHSTPILLLLRGVEAKIYSRTDIRSKCSWLCTTLSSMVILQTLPDPQLYHVILV